MKYILSIDQSTSGTKALLFDEVGKLLGRSDLPHQQKIDGHGWVSHDPIEIYHNCITVCRDVITACGVAPADIAALGISNQRETALIWDRYTGIPVQDAVVWQCDRARDICESLAPYSETIRSKTGLWLSPYFPAGKWAWLLRNTPDIDKSSLCAGTIDTWLIFKLTRGKAFKTDYSNASRTQLFDISALQWDEELCDLFGVPIEILPEVVMSDSCFGETDLEGFLPHPIPIHGVLGDSHGALFGQGCLAPGMVKATYGTGSSVMMNIGSKPAIPKNGVVGSVAWGINGTVSYVLEGNINYTGSVIQWLAEDVGLLDSPKDSAKIAAKADPEDGTYLVPAFSGLGAPHWNSEARAMFCGMSRSTGRAELVKAAEESIAYQITDVVRSMEEATNVPIQSLRVDGGPTRDRYLMQFQSDILGIPVVVPDQEELSGIGAAYCAGIASGIYSETLLSRLSYTNYLPGTDAEWRISHYNGWLKAVNMLNR